MLRRQSGHYDVTSLFNVFSRKVGWRRAEWELHLPTFVTNGYLTGYIDRVNILRGRHIRS